MAKEIIQVDNKIEMYYDKKVLGTFKIKSNSLSGEFIVFMTEDDNMAFVLMECYKENILQEYPNPTWTKLSRIVGNELYANQEEILEHLLSE